MTAPPVLLTPVGGVGRFGRNALLVEVDGGDAILIDCGVRFLGHDEAPGFNFALPDLSRIASRKDRLRAYVITHGHEDHIGALPFAFERASARIITLPFTADMIRRRFERVGMTVPDIEVVEPGVDIVIGAFAIRFIAVSHSIPDSTAVVVETPQGVVVHSGDFRVDETPLAGPPTDMPAFEDVGRRGVRLLLADSTGALRGGDGRSERSVVEALADAMRAAPSLAVVGVYGSHHQRVEGVAAACRLAGRRLVLAGTSVLETARAARRRQLVSYDDVLSPLSSLDALPRHLLTLVTPGCQGEPGSSLDRISRGTHPRIALRPNDTVIVSATAIPGNESTMAAMLDRFAAASVHTVDGGGGRHVSGHGPSGDLERLLVALAPKRFVALHGGHRHLVAHRALAAGLLGDDAPLVVSDGDVIVLEDETERVQVGAPALEPLLHGQRVVDHPGPTIAARHRMTRGGALVVDVATGNIACAGLDPGASRHVLDEVSRFCAEARAVGTGVDAASVVTYVGLVFRRRRLSVPHVLILGEALGSFAGGCAGDDESPS